MYFSTCSVIYYCVIFLQPNFEDPLDTAQDLVDNNIILYYFPGGYIWKQFLAKSPDPAYNKLAETMIITKDWDEFDYYTEHYVIGEGTHAQMVGMLEPLELAMGRWWRSKEKLRGGNPYGGYLSNKKWHLNEVRSEIKFLL